MEIDLDRLRADLTEEGFKLHSNPIDSTNFFELWFKAKSPITVVWWASEEPQVHGVRGVTHHDAVAAIKAVWAAAGLIAQNDDRTARLALEQEVIRAARAVVRGHPDEMASPLLEQRLVDAVEALDAASAPDQGARER